MAAAQSLAVPDTLADKPAIYGKYFLPLGQAISERELKDHEIANILIAAHREDSENFWQFLADASVTFCRSEKTLKNILGTMQSAHDDQWAVLQMSVTHHQKVDYAKLSPGEKEALLTEAFENHYSCEKVNERAREEVAKKTGATPKDRDKSPLEELGERVEAADALLRKVRDRLDDSDLIDEIDGWLLGQ